MLRPCCSAGDTDLVADVEAVEEELEEEEEDGIKLEAFNLKVCAKWCGGVFQWNSRG